MFDFNITNESAVRNALPTLKPWNIYPVTFKGCEIREFEGKKESNLGVKYKVLDIKFEGEDGSFTVTKFFPSEGDDQPKEVTGKNGKYYLPSNFDVLKAVVAQTAQILNPKGWEKMRAASSKFKSFDDMANALIAITNPVIGTKTNLKLIGKTRDGSVYADIPRIVGMNKQGEVFISDNYIGDKLFFTQYEETQREKYLNAAPTPMESFAKAQEKDDSGFDLDDLANSF